MVEKRGEDDAECRELLRMSQIVANRIAELDSHHASNAAYLQGKHHANRGVISLSTEWKTLAEDAERAMRS